MTSGRLASSVIITVSLHTPCCSHITHAMYAGHQLCSGGQLLLQLLSCDQDACWPRQLMQLWLPAKHYHMQMGDRI